MKKEKLFLLILLVVSLGLCFTTGCKATPEDLIVKSKDTKSLMDSVQSTAEPTAELAKVDGIESSSKSEVLEHWTETVEYGNGGVSISIDADVVVPINKQFSVVKIEPKQFSPQDIRSLITALMGNNTVYEYVYGMTKSAIEEVMIKTKMQMTDLNSDMAQSNDIKTLDELKKVGEQELERLALMLKQAPDKIDRKLADKDNLSFSEDGWATVQTDCGKNDLAELTFCNNDSFGIYAEYNNTGNSDIVMSSLYFDIADDNDSNNQSFDIEKKIANQFISDLGLDNLSIEQINKGQLGQPGQFWKNKCTRVVITRNVGSQSVSITKSYGSSAVSEQASPEPKAECIYVYIDDSGIVGLVWRTPMAMTETLNDNVRLMEYEDIKTIIKQQFLNQYSYEPNTDYEYMRYDINKITLSLARVKIPDQPGKYMTIPVWDLFGERCMKTSVERYNEAKAMVERDVKSGIALGGRNLSVNNKGEIVESFSNTSYLTINAVDGSSINRNLGY